MSDKEIQGAIEKVAGAVKRLNQVFDEKTQALRGAGNEDKLREWLTGCIALRDSGDMYISWAQHYAKQGGGTESSDDDFLDEGAAIDGSPSGPGA